MSEDSLPCVKQGAADISCSTPPGLTVIAKLAVHHQQHSLQQQLSPPHTSCLTGSDLASCLTRAIHQSYHVVQEQYLLEARELLLSHDPHAAPVVVGQPLPLDAAFYQRYKQGKVKVNNQRTTRYVYRDSVCVAVIAYHCRVATV